MLGKRSRRGSMRRTTSVTEFPVDMNLDLTATTEKTTTAAARRHQQQQGKESPTTVMPSNSRKNAHDIVMQVSHFLRTCTLCKHRISPGRDIYMYRGDTAYCSLECRQQQMTIDERKEKCSMVSATKEAPPAASEPSGNGETVAAA